MNQTAVRAALLLAGCLSAAATTVVDIDSQKYGCSQCSGPQNVLPGTVLSDIYTPSLQLTLGPGTYTFTNGDPNGTDYYSAWNFNGYPTSGNWVWSFIVANDANSTVLMDDYTGGIWSTQSGAANATAITTYDGNTVLSGTSAAGFIDHLTLGSTTTLDFFIDDYALGDNGGGVAVAISGSGAAPEPASWLLMGVAIAALLVIRRRRQGRTAAI